MAEFTIKKWRCDRCGDVQDKRPNCPIPAALRAGYNYDVAAGPHVEWRELCAPCNDLTVRLIDGLLRDEKEAKARLALSTEKDDEP